MTAEEKLYVTEPCNKKDIEKGLARSNPEEIETSDKLSTDKRSPVANACCGFSVFCGLLWMLVMMISFPVAASKHNSQAELVALIALVFSFGSAVIGFVTTGASKLNPDDISAWRIFFLYLYHYLSALGLMALGALFQRGYNVL